MTLVVGAAGILGQEIVRQLRAAGQPVRALVRATTDPAKRRTLESQGAEIATGDLKHPATLAAACSGVSSVISTASSTLSRAEGDSIDSVDRAGQLAAVHAAKAAGVKHFVFISFPETPIQYPLQDAKRSAERALEASGMSYTIIQTPHFWEVWFSPALGFDAAHHKARIFGEGHGRVSWISLGDVAAVAVAALHDATARNRTLTFGGPDALTQLDVVRLFEHAMNATFELEHVPAEALEAQYAGAADSLQKSFAALMLEIARGGWVFDNAPIRQMLGRELTSIRDTAKRSASA